ncbi:MAG: sulfide/dihydroorotate dehydrogenase-like FAD/NAD-binding protein [Acidobacteriota bacterium]
MFEILVKRSLGENVTLFEVEAPRVARRHRAGQFVMVRPHAHSERIPLTIADVNRPRGSITLVVQAVGKTTFEMTEAFSEGDSFSNVAGPLGNPTHIAVPGKPEDFRGTVACVAGGIGAAPMLPIARAFRDAGHEVVTVLGARRKDLLVFEDRLASVSSELLVCTDDGSYGKKGFVTDVLKGEIESRRSRGADIDLAIAIGPPLMMKFCSKTTEPYGVPTLVSLNTIMVDGTGMCGGCRVMVEGVARYVCVDGPEFDGHRVDFDGMMRRQAMYRPEEAASLERYRENDPSCYLQPAVAAAVSESEGPAEPKPAEKP